MERRGRAERRQTQRPRSPSSCLRKSGPLTRGPMTVWVGWDYWRINALWRPRRPRPNVKPWRPFALHLSVSECGAARVTPCLAVASSRPPRVSHQEKEGHQHKSGNDHTFANEDPVGRTLGDAKGNLAEQVAREAAQPVHSDLAVRSKGNGGAPAQVWAEETIRQGSGGHTLRMQSVFVTMHRRSLREAGADTGR